MLGTGGTVGAAYHAGALYGLWHHTGWDARQATSIVGTSAGSLVGALIRGGASPADLVALARRDGNGGEVADERLAAMQRTSVVTTPGLHQVVGAVRPPTATALLRSVRHASLRPWLLSIPRGTTVDLHPLLLGLDDLVAKSDGAVGWPTDSLRVCTVDARTGRRRVLDHRSGVPLSVAVAASCAVPGLFVAQRASGTELVDGGVHSTTNADVLVDDDLDEVWVVAPMAGSTFRRRTTLAVHWKVERSLRRELRYLDDDVPVRTVVPGRDLDDMLGVDLMDEGRTTDAVLAGFLQAGELASRLASAAQMSGAAQSP